MTRFRCIDESTGYCAIVDLIEVEHVVVQSSFSSSSMSSVSISSLSIRAGRVLSS